MHSGGLSNCDTGTDVPPRWSSYLRALQIQSEASRTAQNTHPESLHLYAILISILWDLFPHEITSERLCVSTASVFKTTKPECWSPADTAAGWCSHFLKCYSNIDFTIFACLNCMCTSLFPLRQTCHVWSRSDEQFSRYVTVRQTRQISCVGLTSQTNEDIS